MGGHHLPPEGGERERGEGEGEGRRTGILSRFFF